MPDPTDPKNQNATSATPSSASGLPTFMDPSVQASSSPSAAPTGMPQEESRPSSLTVEDPTKAPLQTEPMPSGDTTQNPPPPVNNAAVSINNSQIPSKGNTKKMIIILVIVGLVIAALVGFVVLNSNKSQQTSVDVSPSPTNQVSDSSNLNQISCSTVAAYDTDWKPLNASQLSALQPGDVVRFTVSGSASNGNFDQARFTINGTQRAIVTETRPGTDEFFDEYTIPSGVTTINVEAQVHHTQTDTWY